MGKESSIDFGAEVSYHEAGKVLTVFRTATPAKDTAVEKGIGSATKWFDWGDDNDLPGRILKEVEKNPVLFRAMEFNKATHLGGGLVYYFEKFDEAGQRQIQIRPITEIDDFLEENEAQLLQKSFIEDYESLGNFFPELVMTKKNWQVARMFRKAGAWCRLERQDKTTKKINNLLYNADWSNYKNEDTVPIPVLDSQFPLDDLKSRSGKNYNLIYRLPVTSGNRYYYDISPVEVLMNSEWLSVSNMVPKVMKSLMKNLLGVKFILYINESYFHWKYGEAEWKKMSPKNKDEKRKEVKKVVDDYLSGEMNQGKTLLAGEVYINGNKQPGIRIEAIDDKLKEGAWIPEGQEAAANIFYGMGVDPATIGISNNGGKLNSGSEKKSAFWNTQATLFNERIVTLAPWYFISRVNGWNKKYAQYGRLKWGYTDVDTSQTLDENPTGRTNVVKA